MTRRRSIVTLAAAIVVTVVVVVFITFSVGSIRDGVWFGRIIERIEREGPREEYLAEAAEYARSPADWTRILRIAWDMPDPQRWRNVAIYAGLAAERFPRDDRWTIAAAYASIRGGDYEAARTAFTAVDSPSKIAQKIRVLIALNPNDREARTRGIAALGERPSGETIARSIAVALSDRSAEAYFRAAEETEISELYVQSALTAATAGDRETAQRAATVLRTVLSEREGSATIATAYIAAWLRESDWFFEIIQRRGGRVATRPDVLLMQSDLLIDEKQYDRATPIYRELQRTHPRESDIPFINDPAITRSTTEFPDDPGHIGEIVRMYRRGLDFHPTSAPLRIEYASYLISVGRRLQAIPVLVPLGPRHRDERGVSAAEQRRWLIVRTIIGARTPVERLQSDLWSYINEYPDAHLVAGFLAEFLIRRNDFRGIADLRRRYPPESAPWARTVHAIESARNGDLERAETLFREGNSITDRFNTALFSLRHGSAGDIETDVAEFVAAVDRSEATMARTWRVWSLILRAEMLRVRGDVDGALQLAEEATTVSPYDDTVYTYQAILARRR